MEWHEHHEVASTALASSVTAVIARVLIETFSVGTRLPEPFRASPGTMIGLLESLPYEVVDLSADKVRPALRRLSGFGVTGGATCDGLIAAAAAEHELSLVTLDRRARNTYDALISDVRFLE